MANFFKEYHAEVKAKRETEENTKENIEMKYSVEITRDMSSLAHCIQRVNNGIVNIEDWYISINAGGIDYGIYFNFDVERKELEISNQARYDESLYLDDIIEEINEYYDEEYED